MQLSNKPVTPCVFSHGHDDLNDLLKFKFKNGEAR